MIVLIYPISFFYTNRELILPGIAIAFLFIIKSLSVVPMAVLQKELRFGFVGRILLISTLIGTFSSIIMAYGGFKYWSLIWSQYITAIVSSFILYKSTPGLYTKTRIAVIKKSFLFARTLISSLMGFNVVNYWARNADNLIVGKYYGTADLGIYNRAYMMLMMPLNLITGIFSSVLLPSFVKHKREGGDIESEYYFILKVISLVNFPVSVILLLFPQKLVLLLWGQSWISVANLLPYFGLLVLTQTLTSTLGNLLVLQKEEKTLIITGWVSSIFMVAGIIIGSFFSLWFIAALYTLAYLLLVLPFSITYVFFIKLKFVKGIVEFWVPRIFLSLIMWFAIYKDIYNLLFIAVIIWVIMMLWEARLSIGKVITYVKSF